MMSKVTCLGKERTSACTHGQEPTYCWERAGAGRCEGLQGYTHVTRVCDVQRVNVPGFVFSALLFDISRCDTMCTMFWLCCVGVVYAVQWYIPYTAKDNSTLQQNRCDCLWLPKVH